MVAPAGKIQAPFEVPASRDLEEQQMVHDLEVQQIAELVLAELGAGQTQRTSLHSARQNLAQPVERTQGHLQIQQVPSRLHRPILQLSPVVLPVMLPVVVPAPSEAVPPVAVHANRTNRKDQQELLHRNRPIDGLEYRLASQY